MVYLVKQMNREKELQSLLAEERERSQQRKLNYTRLREEHFKLQKDFLALTGQLKVLLHENKLEEDRLILQNDHLGKLMSEKDRLIDDLKSQIDSRHPSVVRESLLKELKEPIRRLQFEKEQLERENERLSYELTVCQDKVNHLEKQINESIGRSKLTFEGEINCLKREKEQLKVTINQLSLLPENKKVNSLGEENCRLKCKLIKCKVQLEESQLNCNQIYKQLNSIVNQIESSDLANESLVGSLKKQINVLFEENSCYEVTIRSSKLTIESLNGHLDQIKGQLKATSNNLVSIKVKYQSKLEQVSRERDLIRKELTESNNDSVEYCKSRDLIRLEYEKLKELLDEEKRNLEFFRSTSESNLIRLRTLIEDERSFAANQINRFEKSIELLKKENSKFKSRINHLDEIREKLTAKLQFIQKSISIVTDGCSLRNEQLIKGRQLTKSMSHLNDLHPLVDVKELKLITPKITGPSTLFTKQIKFAKTYT